VASRPLERDEMFAVLNMIATLFRMPSFRTYSGSNTSHAAGTYSTPARLVFKEDSRETGNPVPI
jgi:hypothetical protein